MTDAHRAEQVDPGIRFEDVAHDMDALLETLLRFADERTRRIGLDSITTAGGEEFEVSTVDLVWEQRNGHYETMISTDTTRLIRRYPTREEATAGHAQIVADLHAGRTAAYQ